MTSVEKKPENLKKNKFTNSAILSILYKKVGRVENTIKETVVNVYSNRYRVNIWKGIDHDFIKNAGNIQVSYFISINDDGIIKIFKD